MFTYRLGGAPQIAPVAAQRAYAQLLNKTSTHFLQFNFSGRLTIAGGAATAIRNRGSLLAAFDEVGLEENGKDRALLRGTVARAYSEEAAPSALSAVRLTNTAAAAYNLKESVRVYFAHPYAANPIETAWREHDVQMKVQAFVTLAASGGADRLCQVGGAVTAVLDQLAVTVQQGHDPDLTLAPFFLPSYRQIVTDVPAANAELRVSLQTNSLLRSIMISQEDTVVGEVPDVLNGVTLLGDTQSWIGPKSVKLEDLIAGSEFEFGGLSGWNSGDAHLGLNFQRFGRLTRVFNPNQDANLRLELDVQPSVVGTGTSKIRVTLCELIADAQLCRPFPHAI